LDAFTVGCGVDGDEEFDEFDEFEKEKSFII
jgi:hypothetical protein